MNRHIFHENPKYPDLVSKYEALVEEGRTALWKEDELLDLILYYETEHLFDRALEVADQGIHQYRYSLDFYLRKAQVLLSCRKEDLAISTLDEAEHLAPEALDIALLRIEALISLDLFEDALASLQTLRAHTNNLQELSDISLSEALVYEAREQYDFMFYALKKAIWENPENKEALERLWLCVELSKKYQESIDFHEQLLENHPYAYLAWFNLGHAYAYLGQYEKAIEAYEFAYVINERFEFAYRDCAEICFELKRFEQALKCYSEVLEYFEPDQDLLLRIGQCYQHLGDFPTAKAFLSKAIHLDPMNDEVHFHLGECYAGECDFRNAISAYRKAIQIEDKREEYYAALGEAYCRENRPALAEQMFREATDIAPETPDYWIQYVRFLMNRQQYNLALDLLDEAIDYAVGPELDYCRVACLFLAGFEQEAFIQLSETLQEEFEHHTLLFEFLPVLESHSKVQALLTVFRPD